MKAVISNRIYVKADSLPNVQDIKKKLTYVFEKSYGTQISKKKLVETVRTYKLAPGNILSLPQGRLDLLPSDIEVVDKRVIMPMPFPNPKFPLRDSQEEIVRDITDSCFINALPGWGKTFTALHLAKKLGQKTLIITHNTSLRDQWISEVEKLFEMDAGIIGSQRFDIEPTIVVANIQSLAKKAKDLCKEFGTVIMDEAHHCPANTFTETLDIMYARYRIGLSGTRQRKDGRHVFFDDFFGTKVYSPLQENTINPVVKILKPGISLKAGEPWARKINLLLYDEDYQQYISNVVKAQIHRGHKVLVVADRVEFLEAIGRELGNKCAVVTGSSSLEERAALEKRLESNEIDCIAGSRQIFSEGISINILSTLVLPSPISNEPLLEQLSGRIMRKHPAKLDPEIIDIQFSGYADKAQNAVRYGFYLKKGWDVKTL